MAPPARCLRRECARCRGGRGGRGRCRGRGPRGPPSRARGPPASRRQARRPAPPSFRRRGRRPSRLTQPVGPPKVRHARPHLPPARWGAWSGQSGTQLPAAAQGRCGIGRETVWRQAAPPRKAAHAMAGGSRPGSCGGDARSTPYGGPKWDRMTLAGVPPAQRVPDHPADQQTYSLFHRAVVARHMIAHTGPCAGVKTLIVMFAMRHASLATRTYRPIRVA